MGSDWWIADEPYPGPECEEPLSYRYIAAQYAEFGATLQTALKAMLDAFRVGTMRVDIETENTLRGWAGLEPLHAVYDEVTTAAQALNRKLRTPPNTGPRRGRTFDHRGRRRY